jgi:iron complex outermembrane receptor protein
MKLRTKKKFLNLPLSLSVAAVAAVPLAHSAQIERSASLEEVIVTAQRREQSLQEVPLAVTALNADAMERRQIIDTKQIIFNVPNLTGNSNVGQQTATTFFLRGVGTTESLATVDTTVAVYVDDVYVARQGVNNFNLFDIERIEVLRGPQGTLYGRNATGGAIKIISKEPSAEPELKIEGSLGNYSRKRLKVSGNTTLVEDKLFFRGSLLTEKGDGYTRNITLGKDVNDLDYLGFRGAFKYNISDDSSMLLTFDWGEDKQNGLYGSDIGNVSRPSTDDLFTVLSGEDTNNTAKTRGVSLKYSVAMSDDWDFESITGYRYTSQDYNLDISDQAQPIFLLTTKSESDQYSQEFKFTGNIGERINLTTGLYLFSEESDIFLRDDFALLSSNPRTPVLFSDRNYNVKTTSYAVYGQADYDLTDRMTLTVGGRYSVDDKSIETNQIVNGSQGFNDDSLESLGVDLEPSFEEFTPKIGLSYEFNDQLNGYVSYARGFRSGGWQARVNSGDQFKNFPAEIVDSYEAGLKASFFDDKVVWNVAAFYTEYSDLFNSVPGDGGGFTVVTADAEIYGFESELTYRATPWLDIFANFGTLETEYVDLAPAVDLILGSELQRSPEFQGKMGFSVDYDLNHGSLLVNGDVFHTGEYYTNPQNGPFSETGPFNLVNLSVGYRSDNHGYTISTNCRNCANEEYFDSILSFAGSGFVVVYPGAPRIYELSFKYEI